MRSLIVSVRDALSDIIMKDDSKNIVGFCWVFTNTHDSDGKLVRRKARLVA